MLDWKPIKDYYEANVAGGQLTSCDFFTNPNGQGGVTFKDANAEALALGIWDYTELAQDTCNCNSCDCTGVPTPKILHNAFTTEGTESVFWSPAGEHNPQCAGSCSSDSADRRVMFTTDFSSLMQEVVDLEDWKQGNAMAVIIDGHSDFDDTPTLRSYESYDGTNKGTYSWTSASPAFGPTLYVSYCLPPGITLDNPDDDGMSSGTLAGIIVAAVLGCFCLIFLGVALRMYRREKAGKPIFQPMIAEGKPPPSTTTKETPEA